MKKYLSLFLCLVLLTVGLTACGTKKAAEDRPYDGTKYAVSHSIDGVSFLYPEYVNNSLVSWDAYPSLDKVVKESSYAEYKSGSRVYGFLKPGEFYIYCISLGYVNHLEGKTDIKTLSTFLGITDVLNFGPRDNETYTTEHVEEVYTKNVFPVVMKDKQTEEKMYGYVSVLKREEDRHFFVYAVGFKDKSDANLKEAKNLVDYFGLYQS